MFCLPTNRFFEPLFKTKFKINFFNDIEYLSYDAGTSEETPSSPYSQDARDPAGASIALYTAKLHHPNKTGNHVVLQALFYLLDRAVERCGTGGLCTRSLSLTCVVASCLIAGPPTFIGFSHSFDFLTAMRRREMASCSSTTWLDLATPTLSWTSARRYWISSRFGDAYDITHLTLDDFLQKLSFLISTAGTCNFKNCK